MWFCILQCSKSAQKAASGLVLQRISKDKMNLSEAEIQLPASLDKAMVENTATDMGGLNFQSVWH